MMLIGSLLGLGDPLIDVSKAHLYVPVGPDDKAYVVLFPDCGKSGVCVCVVFITFGFMA